MGKGDGALCYGGGRSANARLSRAVFGELIMRALISLLQVLRARRLAPVVAALGVLALLSGCVIYPGGGGHRDHYYWR